MQGAADDRKCLESDVNLCNTPSCCRCDNLIQTMVAEVQKWKLGICTVNPKKPCCPKEDRIYLTDRLHIKEIVFFLLYSVQLSWINKSWGNIKKEKRENHSAVFRSIWDQDELHDLCIWSISEKVVATGHKVFCIITKRKQKSCGHALVWVRTGLYGWVALRSRKHVLRA